MKNLVIRVYPPFTTTKAETPDPTPTPSPPPLPGPTPCPRPEPIGSEPWAKTTITII